MKKYRNKTASLVLGTAMLICVMVGTVACGNQDETTSTQAVAVTTEDTTVLVNAETGEELTSEEIAELTKKGAIEVSDNGKVSVKDVSQVSAAPAKTEVSTTAKKEETNPTQKATVKERVETNTEAVEKVTEKKVPEKVPEKVTETPKKETLTEKKTEKATEKVTEAPKEEVPTEKKVVEKTTEKKTEKKTEKSTEAPEAPKACTHNWVWQTHTVQEWVEPVTHKEPVYDDGWTEYFYVEKYYCGACKKYYDSLSDFRGNDNCHSSWSLKKVLDHTVEHEPSIIGYKNVIDEPGYYKDVEVKDYEYCSKCGERK